MLGQDACFVWHKETDLDGADVVILPGGFAYGDYLRTGAIARFSPVMGAVQTFAEGGRAGHRDLQRLPGAARGRPAAGSDAAQHRQYRCQFVHVRVEQTDTPFTGLCTPGTGPQDPDRALARATTTPIRKRWKSSRGNRQVIFRYVSPTGDVTKEANPNGSLPDDIAGICNRGATSSA